MVEVGTGQADIRGIDIDKAAKGFAEEQYVFKSSCTLTPTSAREIRWYSRTTGVLTATSPANIANVAHGTQPFILGRKWTRNTSYVRKYFVESEIISMEDIKDSDPDIFATNIRDLTMAVAKLVNDRILTVTSGASGINTLAAEANWTATTGFPIQDITSGAALVQNKFYTGKGMDIWMHPDTHAHLIQNMIQKQGSSIPGYSSEKMRTGVISEFMGHSLMVSNSQEKNLVTMVTPQKTTTWKTFMPITARTIEEVGIGMKIRVWEEGEAIATDPESAVQISNIA